jgi:hypothetical protein
MPPASKDPQLNPGAHVKGKPVRLVDFFSTLLKQTLDETCRTAAWSAVCEFMRRAAKVGNTT